MAHLWPLRLFLGCILIASGVLQQTEDTDTLGADATMETGCPKASRTSLLQIGKSQMSNIVLSQGSHAEAKAHTPELPRTGAAGDGLFARQGTLPKEKQTTHKKQYAGAKKKQT